MTDEGQDKAKTAEAVQEQIRKILRDNKMRIVAMPECLPVGFSGAEFLMKVRWAITPSTE